MFFRGKHIRHRRAWQALTAFLIFLAAALLAYPFIEPYMIEVEHTALTLGDLPEDIGQLQVVFLSDIHENGFPGFTSARTVDLINKVNSLNADLVILGGDYTRSAEESIAFFGRIPAIHTRYGAFAVMGDRDRIESDQQLYALRNAMKLKGVTLLNNTMHSVRIGQKSIHIAGMFYPTQNNSGTISGISGKLQKDDFVILACHTPEAIEALMHERDANGRDAWFDLGLFGHTLGGQMPGHFDPFHLMEEVTSNHQKGWINENRTWMLISRGVGTAAMPVRIGCRPQIHLITIRKR